MLYLHTEFHIPCSNGSLVIDIKPKARNRFRAASLMLLYILKTAERKLRAFRALVITTISGSHAVPQLWR
jgi:hypothetical protein